MHQFRERRHPLFGRQSDLDQLEQRLQTTGLTAVTGRPLTGKSWLLEELAQRQATSGARLVGFAQSTREGPDLLLRAVIDLYQRWLAQAGFVDQAQAWWDQNKGRLLPTSAKVLGNVVSEIGSTAVPASSLISDALHGLVNENKRLSTGGITVPPLQIDQAQELVTSVHQVTRQPVALVLDEWQDSPAPDVEATLLDRFCRDADQWPPCHIVLGIRDEGSEAVNQVHQIEHGRPNASLHGLGRLDLSDADERDRDRGEWEQRPRERRSLPLAREPHEERTPERDSERQEDVQERDRARGEPELVQP